MATGPSKPKPASSVKAGMRKAPHRICMGHAGSFPRQPQEEFDSMCTASITWAFATLGVWGQSSTFRLQRLGHWEDVQNY